MPSLPHAVFDRLVSFPWRRFLDAALELLDALGYQYADELPLPTRNWPDGVQKLVRRHADAPIYLARHRDLYVVYAHLYGLTWEELDYALETFPIVQRKDEARWREYRTKRMVLAPFESLRG